MPISGGDRSQSAVPDAWDVTALIRDTGTWEDLLDALSEKIKQPRLLQRIVEKDLYVTEAIRHAIVPSEIYPNVRTVFKGGTSLAKAYPILNRFSEDVDVNIIPPSDQEFGHNRRKKARRELHARLDAGIPLGIEHRQTGSNFATSIISYEPAIPGDGGGLGVSFGSVLVEMNIREQPAGMYGPRPVTSLAGEAASGLDLSLLEEYPFLKPFEVLTADPIIAVVDKLDALNWRGELGSPEQVATRARDVYDLGCLLGHDTVRPKLNSDLVSEMHEIVVKSIPSGLAEKATSRPDDGFAAAKAFQPGHPSHDALKAEYPRIRHLVYSDEDWIEFEDAMGVIQGCAHLI